MINSIFYLVTGNIITFTILTVSKKIIDKSSERKNKDKNRMIDDKILRKIGASKLIGKE